jgi:hypothetical protein
VRAQIGGQCFSTRISDVKRRKVCP